MALLAKYPIIIPIMRSTTWLLTIVESREIMQMIIIAPTKALTRIAK